MAGFSEKKSWPRSPILYRATPPRLISKRTMVILVGFPLFMAALLLASKQLGSVCNGRYCDLSNFNRHRFSDTGHAKSGMNLNDKTKPGSQAPQLESQDPLVDECDYFPNTTNVLLVMKTGASEAYSKIPIQLMTMLKCLPDFLIFSDMAEQIGGYTVYDSLETVLDEVKQNKDFDIYRRQKNCPGDHEECNKNHDLGKEGWNLDKYKNIHMAEKAYKMRPNYDWYLFVDADTYISFASLAEWLPKLNADKHHYIGSRCFLGDFGFAHGGTGYLASKATMRSMFFGKKNVGNRYDEPVSKECCGDYMWGRAVEDATGQVVEQSWPVFNGMSARTISYDKDIWCQPLVSLHHVGAEEINDLHTLERDREFAGTLRIKDLYHRFIEPYIAASRADWDNWSDDVLYLNRSSQTYKHEKWELEKAKKDNLSESELQAHESFDHCRTACVSLDDCLQFRFYKGVCSVGHALRHGSAKKRDNEDSEQMMSGWNVPRVKQWIENQGDCGEPLKWPVEDY